MIIIKCKRGRRELSSIRLAVPASRSAAISQMNRAAERLFHHGLELDVSERTFLLQMCTNAFEFVVADAFAQPGAIGVRRISGSMPWAKKKAV